MLMNETGAPRTNDVNAQREAFRSFMTERRLRAIAQKTISLERLPAAITAIMD
jgi:hypothetical protein